MKNLHLAAILTSIVLLPAFASAHSVVSPSQTGTSKYENFFLSVPTEKEIPTTAVKLEIPDGLDRITPVVKPGWIIKTIKDSAGNVKEISWTGGSIPAGQKDFFQFSGRTSASSTVLIWKAHQTYRDGSIVAWDRDPTKPEAGKDAVENPYSTTQVNADTPITKQNAPSMTISWLSLVLAIVALAIAVQNRHRHEH